MNKILAIIFLAILFIFTQNKVANFALATSDKSSLSKKTSSNTHLDRKLDTKNETLHINSNENNSHEIQDENDNDEDNSRIIAIIQGSTPSANIKYAFTVNTHLSSSVAPTPTNTQTSGTITPTPTQTPSVSTKNSQNEPSSASFDFIRELEKLLSSLKRIVFNTIS
jgi:hypothetical protein